MRVEAKFLGFATALVVAAAFTICSLLVAIAPGALSSFLSYALHIDITGLARPITLVSFCVGLLFTAVGAGVLVAAVGGVYNGFVRRRVAGVVPAH